MEGEKSLIILSCSTKELNLNGGLNWSELDDLFLRDNFKNMSHTEMALALKRTRPSVRNRCWRLGLRIANEVWTDNELLVLRNSYSDDKYVDMDALSKILNRSADAIHLKASKLGICNASRPRVKARKVRVNKFESKEALAKAVSERTKRWIVENGHPKGALGMKHSEATKKIISEKSMEMNRRKTNEEKSASAWKGLKTRVKNGTQQTMNRANASWGAGWREIGGIRKYYRSKWEANYARYLEWLKLKGEIQGWLHEPETFWFEGIKRGCLSYLPDFRVIEKNGSIVYHEVKGWMDDRSKTKIKRMAIYHPKTKLIVIDSKGYAAIKKVMQPIISDWEVDAKGR